MSVQEICLNHKQTAMVQRMAAEDFAASHEGREDCCVDCYLCGASGHLPGGAVIALVPCHDPLLLTQPIFDETRGVWVCWPCMAENEL